jgi:c(7)-type cytochrome triheme protein
MHVSSRRLFRGLPVLALLAVAHVPALVSGDGEKVAGSGTAAVEVRLPQALTYASKVGPDQAVVFRHETHVELAGGKCTGCHPAPFRMLRPVRTTSHEEMDARGTCGACHDGKAAFGARDENNCAICHTGITEPAAGTTGDAK